ncbi:MAG: single-stranded-DNA-specific exonuclease [Solirubrobacteraceae bacterium]|nr:single-stranded-DNA-specific exonuclease [Solirubrobacteraceae bacterium]
MGRVLALCEELGVSDAVAQVLVRRGMGDPATAAAFLAAEEEHSPDAFEGIGDAVALILGHVERGSRIVVHGDYDVDGVCSTATLVRSLRRLGADPAWFLPSRLEDGYGLSPRTVQRLAAEGAGLLITVDCAITAVEEVAAARAAGIDVVVTDHHRPRADGALPDAPIVHPVVSNYPCADLCAAAVAWKLAQALEAAAGIAGAGPGQAATARPLGAGSAADDLDLVALATVADCVPLLGENRSLVRRGLRALAATDKPGLRALMHVAQVEPGAMDAHAVGFRLSPRINAAGRLHRADAGLELVLTEDEDRAEAVARELDAANHERRDVETRILFEAERLVSEAGERPAYVLAGEGWHPGVIGIVASRIAERRHRPTVLIALDGDRGTGSGRSIPGFDLLAGLNAASDHLLRHGGHRAAAGLEVARDELDAFRAAFEAHAAATLTPEDLVPVERVDAVVPGDALHLDLAEELARLGPFGMGNPEPALLLPAAQLADPVAMGEGKHVRFTVHGGGHRARAVAFGSPRLPVDPDTPSDATFTLERNRWNGAVEARLVLRSARPSSPPPIEVRGEPATWMDGVLAQLDAPLAAAVPPGAAAARTVVDRRGHGLAGTIASVVASGEPVLVVCYDTERRSRGLDGRLGGFALCSWDGLERDPALADGFEHVLALDPPVLGAHKALLQRGRGHAHLAWGDPELRFAQQITELEYGLRAPLAALYRALRDAGGAEGEELEGQLRGDTQRPRSHAQAGRLLRVLQELRLVSLDRDRLAVTVPDAQRTALERSEAFRAYEQRREEAGRFLERATARAA